MNATATEPIESPETNEQRIRVTEQARIVCGLLKEYAEKLAVLNEELLAGWTTPNELIQSRSAWLLDRSELIRKPLSNVISRGSGLLQHTALDPLIEDELALRMREIEIHLHHTLRLAHDLRKELEQASWTDQVKKLRVAAGLNAMKGGPLDPE